MKWNKCFVVQQLLYSREHKTNKNDSMELMMMMMNE